MARNQRLQARECRRQREPKVLQLAVGDRIGDALQRVEEHGGVLAITLARAGAETRHEIELAAALRAVERARGRVRRDERAQARPQPAPSSMQRDDHRHDAPRARRRLDAQHPVDCRPFRGHPRLVDGEKERPLVGEMLVERRRRVPGGAGEAVRVRPVIAVAVEDARRGRDETRVRRRRRAATRTRDEATWPRRRPLLRYHRGDRSTLHRQQR